MGAPMLRTLGSDAAWSGGKVPGLSRGLGLGVQRVLADVSTAAATDDRGRAAGMRAYYDDAGITALLTDDALAHVVESRSARQHEYFEHVATAGAINQASYLDAKLILPELNLAYCDKMSMAASVESRVPYLDLAVVAVAAALPPDLKVRGRVRKYALRRALAPDLPEWVLARRKAGFGAPIRQWLRADLADMVGDLLSEDAVRARGLFRPEAVTRMIQENRSGQADHAFRLWTLLTLEIWQRSVLEGTPRA
jgi:asparagine synthase (glutamine-hydrolysing)